METKHGHWNKWEKNKPLGRTFGEFTSFTAPKIYIFLDFV